MKTAAVPAAYQMAGRVRQLGLPTVMGGSHASFLADEALDHCDYVVRGEGHFTLLELAAALQTGGERAAIAGLSYRDAEGRKVHNAPRPYCSQEEFARLPAPDLSLVVGRERMTSVPIMTQWSCSFDCDLSGVTEIFGRQVRARRIGAVLDELQSYRDRGAVFFCDDNLVVSKERTRALLRGMIERGLTPAWSAQVPAEVVYQDKETGELDHELLSLMRDSGCTMVYCSFESVRPATREAGNKQRDAQTIRAAVRAFHTYGIGVHGRFVIGSDADDAATAAETVEFALENQMDTLQLLMLTPCPGTAFYKRLSQQGRLLSDDWALYDGQHCVIQPARMTPYELQVSVYKSMAQFYSARLSYRMLVANLARNLPFLAGLLWRERKLGLRLPRIAMMFLLPQQRPDMVRVLSETLAPVNWKRLQKLLMVPMLRFQVREHIGKWARQAHSRAYVRFLQKFSPHRANAAV